ncbi:MAG: TPM domain-containing protein, partial [Mycobacterium sp.]
QRIRGPVALGTFTRLTKANADLDRLLASVTEERQNAERLARQLDQAWFTAGSRVKAVSDFIDTRRGSVGSEARTRLAEATLQLEAANAKRGSSTAEAIAHANGASTLAAQAQQLANDDVARSQRQYTSNYGGRGGGNDMGAVLGGIIIGSILNSGGGRGGTWGPGRSAGRSTSYGGSSRSSSRSYGGGGRF